jgi:Flp pilus assembly protein protease CpaA
MPEHINIGLAAILSCIAFYTDLKDKLIYNRHVFPFIMAGMALAAYRKHYYLLVSGLIVFAMYVFIFSARKLFARLASAMGGVGIPESEHPVGGGDVKLSLALALFLGALPVLYGTILAAILLIVCFGLKAWKATGSPMAALYAAAGKLPGPPMAFGAILGPCSVVVSLILK